MNCLCRSEQCVFVFVSKGDVVSLKLRLSYKKTSCPSSGRYIKGLDRKNSDSIQNSVGSSHLKK